MGRPCQQSRHSRRSRRQSQNLRRHHHHRHQPESSHRHRHHFSRQSQDYQSASSWCPLARRHPTSHTIPTLPVDP